MAANPDEEENELNFSDIDSDDDSAPPVQKGPLIAHKDMSRYVTAHKDMSRFVNNQKIDDSPNDIVAISPVAENPSNDNSNDDEPTFEPISPVSDTENNFEAISPPASPSTQTKNENNSNFENISDDEEEKIEEEVIPEGKFSPERDSDNELNFNDESSNDSGYQIVKPAVKPVTEVENVEELTSEDKKDELEDDDVEAPLPSPFSDLGDPDDLPDTEGGIINDILNGSGSTEGHFVQPINETLTPKDNEKPETDSETTNTALKSTEIEEERTVQTTVESELPDSASVEGESIFHPIETSQDTEIKTTEETVEVVAVEEENKTEEEKKENETKADEEDEEDAGDLIADIFGDSDEEEEFEGFADEDLLPEKTQDDSDVEKPKEKAKPSNDAADSSDDDMPIPNRDFVSDFDLMLQKRKEMNRMKRRAKKDFDIINDNDDIIAAMIKQMKDAAEEDRMLNQCGKAATKKMKMLPNVTRHLMKADLQGTFIDCGILPALKDWLTPLPDHALPHINIRKTFLKMLQEFPPLDKGALKVSGIGRAVMLLFKHPKETTENRRIAGKIISNWARPIFNVSTNFQELSREEREDRDKANLPDAKRRRLSSGADSNRTTLGEESDGKPRKPGDKGWIGRARVPMPSHRDYVNRPLSKVDSFDTGRSSSNKELSRYEKQMRKMKDKRTSGSGKAVGISLNGSKLTL